MDEMNRPHDPSEVPTRGIGTIRARSADDAGPDGSRNGDRINASAPNDSIDDRRDRQRIQIK